MTRTYRHETYDGKGNTVEIVDRPMTQAEIDARAKSELEASDRQMVRVVEEIFDAMTDAQKALISQRSKDIISARKELRAEISAVSPSQ